MEPVFIVLLIAVLLLGLVVGFMADAAMAEKKIDSLSKELDEHESDSARLYWESRWLEGFNAGATARDNTVPYYDNPYEIEDDAEHDGWKCGWRYWEYILHGDRSAEEDVEYTKRYPYGGNTPVLDMSPHAVGKSRMMRQCCGETCHDISPSQADPVDVSGVLEPDDALDEELGEDGPTLLSMPQCCGNKEEAEPPRDEAMIAASLEAYKRGDYVDLSDFVDELKAKADKCSNGDPSPVRLGDAVKILVAIPSLGLEAGSPGVVVDVYPGGSIFQVEFARDDDMLDTTAFHASELEAVHVRAT